MGTDKVSVDVGVQVNGGNGKRKRTRPTLNVVEIEAVRNSLEKGTVISPRIKCKTAKPAVVAGVEADGIFLRRGREGSFMTFDSLVRAYKWPGKPLLMLRRFYRITSEQMEQYRRLLRQCGEEMAQ